MSFNHIVYHKYMHNANMYNIMIGIAQLNAFSCSNEAKYTLIFHEIQIEAKHIDFSLHMHVYKLF